ncbi:PTS sugar transporter subunit IIA [Bacillus ndiopicus]|uniref:PTS sugar transporter subunit IIA n=1 Tax=Bacillus ndiopicus TaxID=1347368 RepID=UPI0005A8C928|nr:PTS sugar transporter subunit IIA [Bacillus ndiopicus]
MYVEKNLVFYSQRFEDQNQLFDFMADELEKQDYVRKEFREAIKVREQNFPTGLQLQNLNVAIVHTEVEYSKAEKLVIMKLEKPLIFRNIATLEPLDVELIIGLILNDSNKHLEVLQKVSQLLQSEAIIQEIKDTSTHEELAELMQNYFN